MYELFLLEAEHSGGRPRREFDDKTESLKLEKQWAMFKPRALAARWLGPFWRMLLQCGADSSAHDTWPSVSVPRSNFTARIFPLSILLQGSRSLSEL